MTDASAGSGTHHEPGPGTAAPGTRYEPGPGEATSYEPPLSRASNYQPGLGDRTISEPAPGVATEPRVQPTTTWEPALPSVPGQSAERTRLVVPPDQLLAEYDYLDDISTAGAQADVVRCRSKRTGQDVAVKIYRGLIRIDVSNQLGRADPRHVVPMTIDSDGRRTWEIQEYLPLGSLEDYAQQHGLPLPEAVVRRMLVELTDAIEHIQSLGIVHRDLKPGNILIRDGDELDLVLADFGFAKEALTGGLGSTAGTYPYMAPEGTYGRAESSMDWWPVGVIIHEFLGGRHIFAGYDGARYLSDGEVRAYLIENKFSIANITDPRWHLLISGLLTHDATTRWAAPQIREWLAGGSPAVAAPTQGRRSAGLTFDFMGVRYNDPVALADAFAQQPEQAYDLLADPHRVRDLEHWLHQTDVGDAADGPLLLIRQGGEPRRSMVEILMIMAPALPPMFDGVRLDADELSLISQRATQGDGQARKWIRSLRTSGILSAVARQLPDGTQWSHAEELLHRWWTSIDRKHGEFEASAEVGAHLDSVLGVAEGQLLAAALDLGERNRLEQWTQQHLAGLPSDYPRPIVTAVEADLGHRVVATGLSLMLRSDREAAVKAEQAANRAAARLRQQELAEQRATERLARFRRGLSAAWRNTLGRLGLSLVAAIVSSLIVATVLQAYQPAVRLVVPPLLIGVAIGFVADAVMPGRASSRLSHAAGIAAAFWWAMSTIGWAGFPFDADRLATNVSGLVGWAPIYAVAYAAGGLVGTGVAAVPTPEPRPRPFSSGWLTILLGLSVPVAVAGQLFQSNPVSVAIAEAPEFVRDVAAAVQFDIGGLSPIDPPGSTLAGLVAVLSLVVLAASDDVDRLPRGIQIGLRLGLAALAALVVAFSLGYLMVALWVFALVMIPVLIGTFIIVGMSG